MIQKNISYRPIQSSDYVIIEDMIRKSWNYDRLGSSKLAKNMAKVYLASCLSNQTFTCVAVSDVTPIGIIMGKNNLTHCKSLKYQIREGISIAQIAMSKEGRKVGKLFEELEQANQILIKRTQQTFEAELSFFVVAENQQGSGIGKQLYKQFLDYMMSESLTNFFLYTDTTCNYGFYEKLGLSRLAEESFDSSGLKVNMKLYLYGMQLI